MNAGEILTALGTLVILFFGAIGISQIGKDEDPDAVPAQAEPDTLQQWIVQKGDIEYQMAVDLADSLLRVKYSETGLVYRPRNFMITFVASSPDILSVTASWWLESISTGMFQKCEGHVTLERGDEPNALSPGLFAVECE